MKTVIIVTLLLWVSCCGAHIEDKPNIVIIYADDLGWGNVGWHNPNKEIVTPNLDQLAKNEGLILDRHYVHYVCSPSRSALMTGRLPCHLTVEGPPGTKSDDSYNNMTAGKKKGSGIPENMTTIASKMKLAGYSTHIVGKWDVGHFNNNTIPKGREFDTSMVYFTAMNDYFTQQFNVAKNQDCMEKYNISLVDLWGNNASYNGPLYGLNGTDYEEFLFQNELNKLINNFSQQTDPFFLIYTPHLVHAPQQIPHNLLTILDNDEYNCSENDPYIYPGFNNSNGNNINYKCRSIYQSMVRLLDTIIGNLTQQLKENNLWNNTLLIFSSDNGGPIGLNCCSANNWPLRGGKHSIWEGGIRGAAFVSGGYLPKERIGKIENGMISVADWYTTLCDMVGVDSFDEKGAKHNLPPVEGYNIWPLIAGLNETSPRTLLPIDTTTVIQNEYKFIIYEKKVSQAAWCSQIYPNSSTPFVPQQDVYTVKIDCSTGCLFDLLNDYREQYDISNDNKDIVEQMNNTLNELIKGYYVNNDTFIESCPPNITMDCDCWTGVNKFNGFMGPWCY